jgi:hypothetical protein
LAKAPAAVVVAAPNPDPEAENGVEGGNGPGVVIIEKQGLTTAGTRGRHGNQGLLAGGLRTWGKACLGRRPPSSLP